MEGHGSSSHGVGRVHGGTDDLLLLGGGFLGGRFVAEAVGRRGGRRAAGVLTVTSAAPAVPAGEVTLHEVADLQITLVPALAPNLTVVEPTTKPPPVMVTTVPPASGPVLGMRPVTVGTLS